MKKLLPTVALFLILASSWAADAPRRFFETGFDLGVAASNNYIGLTDFFQETLVIDLDQIAADLSKPGFRLSGGADASWLMNLNLGKTLQMGVFFGLQGTTYGNVPGSLFELIAEGNTLDKAYTGDFLMWGDLNVELGAHVGTRIPTPVGPITVDFKPVYYMPLIHIEDPKTTYLFETRSDGTVVASLNATVPIYSVVSLEGIDSGIDTNEVISNLFSSGGLDLSVTGEYQLFPVLAVGASLKQIPIVPARLSNRALMTATYSVETQSVLDGISLGEEEEGEEETEMFTTTEESDFTYDSSNVSFVRPFKIGLHAGYTPFGKLLTVTPSLGLGVYNSVFMECGLEGKLNLANILILSLGTQYEDLAWSQQLRMIFNLRVLELNLFVGAQSPSFLKSFTGAGLGAGLGVRMGF